MRRRLLIASLILDGLCTVAAPFLFMRPDDSERYTQVGDMCVELFETGDRDAGEVSGRPADASLCLE